MEIFWSSPMPARRGYSRRSTVRRRCRRGSLRRRSHGPRRRPLATALIGWAAVLAASMLGWPALAPDAPRHVVPTFGAGLAALLGRGCFSAGAAAHGITIGLAVGACGFAALAGWLAVPGGPASANATLALSACAVVAHWRRHASAVSYRNDYACGVRGVGVGGGTDARCGAAVVARRGDRTGPGRRVAGRVVGGAAAGRRALSAPDPVDGALTARTLTAHRRLTAAVVTAAGGTTLGCLVTAVATPPSAASTAMLAAAAAILLLRMRVHAERRRAAALAIGAALVSTALFGTLLVGSPGLLPWLCGVPAAAFVAGIRLAAQRPGVRAGACAGSHRPRSSPRRRPSRRWGVGRPACSARCVN